MDPWKQSWVDYYEDLGVSPSTSAPVIEAAYKALAQEYHPSGGRQPNEEQMKRINVAYEVLSDPPQRNRYDEAYRTMSHDRALVQRLENSAVMAPPPTRQVIPPPVSTKPEEEKKKDSTTLWKTVAIGSLVVLVVAAAFAAGLLLRGGGSDTPPAVAAQGTTSSGGAVAAAPIATETPTPVPTATTVPTPTPTLTPTPTPSPTPTPAPQPGAVIYQADWSTGSDDWPGINGWKISGGQLLNDGTQFNAVTWAPTNPGVDSYEVDLDAKFITGTAFGIVVRSTSDDDGYLATFGGYGTGWKIGTMNLKEVISDGTFLPDRDWHTYGVRVVGNQITILLDGGAIGQITDNRFLSGGRIGLWDYVCQVSVRSFKVVAR